MAWTNPFKNVFDKVTSVFAKENRSFSEAWDAFKKYAKPSNFVKQYHRWRESVIFERTRPFIESGPDWMKVQDWYLTPTPSLLSEKYQYVFNVGIKLAGQAMKENIFLSFLESEDLTKREAIDKMTEIFIKHPERMKYGHIDELDISLVAVKTSMWL